jgi:hypothetical protein
MKTNDITENNKLIAEFMSDLPEWGLSYIKDNYSFYINPWSSKANTYDEKMEKNGFYLVPNCSFNFHSSWDWLMPVVEKIWSITENRSSLFYFEVRKDNETILITSKVDQINNITDCYNTVIEFIIWYNQNK